LKESIPEKCVCIIELLILSDIKKLSHIWFTDIFIFWKHMTEERLQILGLELC
jgi:hypothetical protein